MMKILFAILFVSLIQFSVYSAKGEGISSDTTVYIIDTDSSKVEWECDLHTGYVLFENGELKVVDGEIVDGTLNACMDSIVDLEIDYELMRLTFQNTLKSIDFFYTEKYPFSNFTIDHFESTQGSPTIFGDLTILGVTKCISFQYDLILKSDTLQATTQNIILDRTDFGNTSMSLEDARSDNSFIVPNDFKIVVTLIGVKSAQ